MTKKMAVILAIIATMIVGGANPALAKTKKKARPAAAQAKKEAAPKHDDKAMHEAMHNMMLETHDIMLETVKLVKRTAMDKETAQMAEQLQHRLEDLIQRHKAMHDAMHGGQMHEGTGGYRFGPPNGEHMGHMNNMENMEHMNQMDHMDHMEKMEHDKMDKKAAPEKGKPESEKGQQPDNSEVY